MRKRTTQHFATVASQVERFPGGLSWDNPNNALAINGNVGATLPAITTISDGNWTLGPGYVWWTSSSPQPAFVSSATDNQKFPNALRFSGFNINDATANSIVTNLYVRMQYSDNTTTSYTPRDGTPNGGNWLITPVKSGGVQLYRKRFKDLFGTGTKTYNARIPCTKDQSWATSTFGPGGVVPDTVVTSQRSVPAAKNNKIALGYGDFAYEYYDSTAVIKPLTVAEINDPNFYIEIWHTHSPAFALVLSQVKIYSVSVDVEYIAPASKNITMYYKNTTPDYVRSRDLGFGYQEPWTSIRSAGGFPTATQAEFTDVPASITNYAWFNVFDKPYPINDNGNVNDELIKFDSDYMFGRMPAIADIDDSTNSISDIILDVRVNMGRQAYDPKVKWSYLLSNGIGQEVIDQRKNVTGEVLWKYAMQGRDAGTRDWYNGPGEPWLIWKGEYNLQDNEYYGGSDDNWTTKHIPIRLTDPLYVNYPALVNNVAYPGAVYDPLWIEKALKTGNLYVGLVLTVDPGTAVYWNTSPHPTAWIKVDAVSLRVLYTPAGVTPPPTPPPTEIVSDAGLLYRFTP